MHGPSVLLDSRAALSMLGVAALTVGCGPRPPERPNLLLVVADTLRADYLGCYGFDGAVSPALDRLAAEGVLFEHCVSQAPWTKPATASLLTSLYPGTHGLTDHEGGFWSESPERRTGVLPGDALTLAEVLAANGYRTAGFTANSWLVREYGFAQGFQVYDDYAARLDTDAEELLGHARTWLAHSDESRPFFLYLHFMDVHAPYDGARHDYEELARAAKIGADRPLSDEEVPYNRWHNIDARPEWASDALRHRLTYWRARYASGVRALDRRLGRFLDELERSGELERTLVVVTSDHGEHLFEHGDWSHGQNLFEHQLRIPLVVRAPASTGAAAGLRVPDVVELVDVMPTVLSLLDLVPPAGMQGRDLAPLVRGEAGQATAGGVGFATAVQRNPNLHAVRTAKHKLIVDLSHGGAWLFDLEADPEELVDLSAQRPETVAELRALLDAHLARQAEREALEAEEVVIPEDVQRRLEALGYN